MSTSTRRSDYDTSTRGFVIAGVTGFAGVMLMTVALFQILEGIAAIADDKVYVTGITDVQQHGIYTLSAAATFQAGEYVKFNVGGAFTAEQGHIITFDQPCNPDFKKDAGTAGPCKSAGGSTGDANANVTGIPNPNYRAVIDAPGRRFRADGTTQWDAWVNAVVMF